MQLTYTLSRCEGNRSCWHAQVSKDNPMYVTGSTDSNLGRLIERYSEQALRDGEPIPWFVLETTTEGEAAARVDRIEGERKHIAGEIKAAQRVIRDHKKRLAELSAMAGLSA